MMDFGSNDLFFRAIMSERNRDAEAVYRLAEYRQPPRGIRASIATRLAHLAVHLDSETTDRLVGTHQNATGHS
jgi:hypothetical protein